MQCMNCSIEKLVKSLSDDDFKYLAKAFRSKNLEFLKQKGAYPFEYMNSFKRFNEKKFPEKNCFYSSVKDGPTNDNGEKLQGYLSDENYLTFRNIWNKFSIKNMDNYHEYYLKKDVLLSRDVSEKFIYMRLKF